MYTKPESMIEEFKTCDSVMTTSILDGDGIENMGGNTEIDD